MLGRRIAIHARAGATVAVAFAPAAADTAATLHLGTLDVAPAPYGAASSVNPLVADGRIEVLGAGPLEGLRLGATTASLGFLNPVLSIAEDLIALFGSVMAILLPMVAFLAVMLTIVIGLYLFRTLRSRSKAAAAPATS